MTSIGFIGLGVMGLPMAARLVEAGHEVRGSARSAPTLNRARERGVETAESARDAARGADVVITMLPDTPDVEAVLLGGGVLEEAARSGAVVVDMSTIDPVATVALHERAADLGVAFLDAPVSGGEAAAISGDLIVMAGGAPQTVSALTPTLRTFGSVEHVGAPGAGQTVKAANQVVVAGNIQVLAEAMTLLRRQGIDLDTALGVLGAGLAGSTVLTRKRAAFVSGEHAPGFRLALHHKDLGIARDAARRAGVVMPVASVVSELVMSAVQQGQGALDHSALFPQTDRLSGGSGSTDEGTAP